VTAVNPEEFVRGELAAGRSLDEVAAGLIQSGVPPIEGIKAMRKVSGLDLGDLKVVMDRALPPEWHAANERLRHAAIAALTDDEDAD
jgi:hypothetical protein